MIAGILQTAFWIGMVLVVALCAGIFWLIVNFLLDKAVDLGRAQGIRIPLRVEP